MDGETHCRLRSYMVSVKKCGLPDCHICKLIILHHLPDPVLKLMVIAIMILKLCMERKLQKITALQRKKLLPNQKGYHSHLLHKLPIMWFNVISVKNGA